MQAMALRAQVMLHTCNAVYIEQCLACRYWELDPANCESCSAHKPYRIEVIGVTCDAGLAVARGVWRKLRTGRSVRSSTLLRSHRLFSEHFEKTASLVDVATLYHTGHLVQRLLQCAVVASSAWQPLATDDLDYACQDHH